MMPDTAEGRERLARLETQMGNLTDGLKETKDELSDAKDAIKELTAALNQLRGGLSAARWVGGLFTAGGVAAVAAAWNAFTWFKGAR